MEQIDLTQLIKDVEYKVTQILVNEVQKGVVSDEEAREIASYILDKVPTLHSVEAVDAFLKELASNWSIFATVSELTHMKVVEVNETHQALEKVKEQLASVSN